MIDYKIEDILPQRQPYILVDKLIYYDDISAKTVFEIREENVFCENGVMEEAGLIENIAQTCAARTGYKTKLEAGADEVVKIGYLGMIRNMKILRKAKVGETLTTTMEIKAEIFSTTLVEARVEADGETIAECEMKIFLTDKTSEI